MSTAARIDELRIKFEENPRRYFAPLANEYRKAGDLAQAIALCREHLPKQPGHMSGYIVFGQALYEAGELTEAREVFAQAIELDPENVIALQHLGNIAQAVGDDSSARRWLGRVLDADPRNDDIAAQLATLGSAAASPPMHPVVPNFESLARVTPPLPMTVIGLGAQPTPDAVMRAIDVDAVNEHMSHRTPLDLDAMDSTDSEAATDAVQDAEGIPDAFTFPDAQAEPDTMTAEDEADAFGDVTMDADEESFEEGLIAANWPDTSELVARVMTPRGFTARIATPLDTATIDEAISAFGREPGDPAPDAAETDHEDVVPEPIAEIVTAPVVETNVVEASVVEEDVIQVDVIEASVIEPDTEADVDEDQELPWLAMSEVDADDVVELADAEPGLEAIAEAFAEDARAAGNEGPMVVEARDDSSSFEVSESFADVAQELVAEAEQSTEESDDDSRTPSFVELQGFATPSESEAPAFVTETMGELLVSQGFVSRAVDVYEELVRRRPYDPVLAARLAELRETLVPQVEMAQDVVEPTPAYGTPAFATPAVSAWVTPYAQPAMDEPFMPRRSAREWFAAIAARRVPRRTPPQSTAAVESSPEGLAALFGNDPSGHDDEAAQALADAFAPLSAEELEAGSALDFEFARSTPAFSATVDARVPRDATPMRSPTITPVIGNAAFPAHGGQSGMGNAGFSFDRFFPDPATRRPTPAPELPVVSDAPVTDDLAQFSAWLKGLGNT